MTNSMTDAYSAGQKLNAKCLLVDKPLPTVEEIRALLHVGEPKPLPTVEEIRALLHVGEPIPTDKDQKMLRAMRALVAPSLRTTTKWDKDEEPVSD